MLDLYFCDVFRKYFEMCQICAIFIFFLLDVHSHSKTMENEPILLAVLSIYLNFNGDGEYVDGKTTVSDKWQP